MHLNFLFKSSDHLRYENGNLVSGPHGGARRAVKVEPNVSGGEGCIVTIYNLDGDHPIWQNNVQMAPKQMRIVEQNEEKVVLRGFGQDITGASFANYGLTIYFINGEVSKCFLHLHDREIKLEYLKEESVQSNKEYIPIELGRLYYSGQEDPVEFIQSQINSGVLVSPAEYEEALFIVENHKDPDLVDRYRHYTTKEYIVHLLKDIKVASENGNYPSSLRNEFLCLNEIITTYLRLSNFVGIQKLIKSGNASNRDSFYSNEFKK